jgi:hypothetical protein
MPIDLSRMFGISKTNGLFKNESVQILLALVHASSNGRSHVHLELLMTKYDGVL